MREFKVLENTTQEEQGKEMKTKKVMEAVFEKAQVRVACGCQPSLDVWTPQAHDMLKIAGLAGFDLKALMRDCFRRTARTKAARINVRTVYGAMQRQRDEAKEKE